MDQKPRVDATMHVEEVQKLHEQVKGIIERANMSYQAQANKHKKKMVFQPGVLVWIHLRKEGFQSKYKNKIMA